MNTLYQRIGSANFQPTPWNSSTP